MRTLPVTAALLAASAVAAAGAAAAAPPITAEIPAGHRLIAQAPDGTVATGVRRGRAVAVRPTASRVTLHLIGPDGAYLAPVVVGQARGGRAVVGVRAGARLGRIRVSGGTARATVAGRAADPSRTAVAVRGVPIGSGRFGLVRSTATGPAGPGRDLDLDGVTGAFDIDDDGDLILDNLDAAPAARAAQLPPPGPVPPGPVPPPPGVPGPIPPGPAPGPLAGVEAPRVFSNLKLGIESSLNANAGVTRADITTAMRSAETLAIAVPDGDAVELDCGLLTYCTLGGTGRILGGAAFPASVDADGDGFGTITRGPTGDFQLQTGAGPGEIGAGDAFVWRVTRGGAETLRAGVLNYAFVTTPAIVSFAVNGGAATTVSYPAGAGTPGSVANPIVVPAAGTVRLTLTAWRPQRRAIRVAGERGDWTDIGGLTYSFDLPNAPSGGGPGSPGGPGPGMCRDTFLSTTDPGLVAAGDGMRDTARDAAPDPARTVTLTADLTACVASRAGETWDPGETLKVDLQARTADGDNAAQAILLRRATS